MNCLILFLVILLGIIIYLLIFQSSKCPQVEKYQEDLPNLIINLILYTPLTTPTLVNIVNNYQGEKSAVYRRKLREIIGFLRSPHTQKPRYQDYFLGEARRYLTELDIDDKPIFTLKNLKYFIDGVIDETRKIQNIEDDLD